MACRFFEGGFRGFTVTYRFLRVDLEVLQWPIGF